MNDNDRRRLDIGDIRYVVDETDAQVYLAVLEAIRDFPKTDQDPTSLQDPAFFYLRAADPEKDGNVDVDAAGYNWINIVGHGKIVEIPGGGHANPRQAPGYIRIVDGILQEVIVESYSDRRELSDATN